MSAVWLGYALVTGALLTAAAWAAEGVVRGRRWPTRWIWAASMAATLALAVRALSARAVEPAGDLTIKATGAAASGAAASPVVTMLREARVVVESAVARGVAAVARPMPALAASAAATAWLALAAITLGALALVQWRMWRARRAWPSAELHGRRVRVAPTVGPAVIGLVRPEIVVPRWLLERSAAEQRLVLAHEEEHVRAGDHLLLAGACVVVALMPWHPAAWWSLARLRLAMELDCDARVLRRGVLARTYGEMLIDLAGQCSGFRLGATALADKTTHLERRLIAMKPITARFAIARAGALCATAAIAILAACEAKVPTSAEIDAMDVASAQRDMQVSPVEHVDRAVFYVDGTPVDARTAHALTPNQIGSVNVTMGATPTDPATIRITTTGESAAAIPSSGLARMHSALRRVAPGSSQRVGVRIPSEDKAAYGLIMVDGVRADQAAIARLKPADIKSVEILKGPLATKLYSDPAAANGVIKVTTKGQ